MRMQGTGQVKHSHRRALRRVHRHVRRSVRARNLAYVSVCSGVDRTLPSEDEHRSLRIRCQGVYIFEFRKYRPLDIES